MATCQQCDLPMSSSVTYRKYPIRKCKCGRMADIFLDVELDIADVEIDGVKFVDDLLIPEWMRGKWRDMNKFGMEDEQWYHGSCSTRLREGRRFAAVLEQFCPYPWALKLTFVGSGAEEQYRGPGER